MPTRRINTDPAAQTRSLAIAFVAIIAVLAVIVLAILVSRMGDNGSPTTPPLTPKTGTTQSAGGATTAPGGQTTTVAPGTSGLPVTPGVVPDVTAQTVEKARLAIAEAGYKVKERHENATQPKGTIVTQSPAADVELQQGLEVTIVISDGP